MSSSSSRVVSAPRFCVIFVCDFEDYSLWCQTVESSSTAALSKRFLGTAALLSDLLGGSFLKSTGDGVIAIWAHNAAETEEGGQAPADEQAFARDVMRASLLANALQLLSMLGFGFSWPIPRQLRCAVHVGGLHRLTYTRLDGTEQTDFVGEALNAACRLERLGDGVMGAVLSEHACRVLGRTGTVLPMELPAVVGLDLKSAQWLGKRVYGQPTATLLHRIRETGSPNDVEAFTSKFMKNAAAFLEEQLFQMFVALWEAFQRLDPEAIPEMVPDWLGQLSAHTTRVVGDPYMQFDGSFSIDLESVVRQAYDRFRTSVAADAPAWAAIRSEWTANEGQLDPGIRNLLGKAFPSPRVARKKNRR